MIMLFFSSVFIQDGGEGGGGTPTRKDVVATRFVGGGRSTALDRFTSHLISENHLLVNEPRVPTYTACLMTFGRLGESLSVCMCRYVHVCIYIGIYIYIYMHIRVSVRLYISRYGRHI